MYVAAVGWKPSRKITRSRCNPGLVESSPRGSSPMYICIRIYICTYTYIHIYSLFMFIKREICTCIDIDIHIYICIYIHMLTCVYIYTHVHNWQAFKEHPLELHPAWHRSSVLLAASAAWKSGNPKNMIKRSGPNRVWVHLLGVQSYPESS